MIKKASVAVLSFIIFLLLLEKLYDFCLKGNYNIKASYVSATNINAEVLVLGTSNSLYMFDVETFKKETGKSVYNLSTNHSSFAENLGHLYLYLKNNKAPECLFLGINPADLTLSSSAFHTFYFLPFINDPGIKELVFDHDKVIKKLYLFPFSKYAIYNEFINPLVLQGAWQILRNNKTAYFQSGTYPVPTGKGLFNGYDNFKRNNPNGVSCKLEEKDVRELKALLKLASDNKIRVVVYIPSFLDEVKKYIPCEEKNNELKKVAFDFQAEFWRFDTLKICESRNWFVSAFHTNPEGSKVFTKALSKRLLLQ